MGTSSSSLIIAGERAQVTRCGHFRFLGETIDRTPGNTGNPGRESWGRHNTRSRGGIGRRTRFDTGVLSSMEAA